MSKKSENLPIGPGSSPRESADYLNRAFATSDIAQICQAIGVVTHLHNISTIAKKAGIERTSLYRAFARGSTASKLQDRSERAGCNGFPIACHSAQGRTATPADGFGARRLVRL